MARTAGSKFSLVALVLLPLSQCPGASDCPRERGDAHCLRYDFSITIKGESWCKVQGQVDEKNFLSYDCGSDKVISGNLLGEEVNPTGVWKAQLETLRDVGQRLKVRLPDIKRDIYPDEDLPTLQARLTCQCKANGCSSASWEFGFQQHGSLCFDSENGMYTVVHPEGEWMKEKWEADKELTKTLTVISKGDCGKWLQSLVPREKLEETTAPTVKASATAQSNAIAIRPTAWNLIVVLTCFILTGFLDWLCFLL